MLRAGWRQTLAGLFSLAELVSFPLLMLDYMKGMEIKVKSESFETSIMCVAPVECVTDVNLKRKRILS